MPFDQSEDLMGAWAAAEAAVAAREAGETPPSVAQAERARDAAGKFAKPEPADAQKEEAQAPTERQTAPVERPAAGEKRPEGKPGDVAAPEGAPSSIAELQELAKKHGFVVEDAKVLPRERHAFREERREARARLERERAEWQQQREAEVARIRSEGSAVIKAAQAYQAKDWDAFAQALGAKDWNELNGEVIGTFADPNFKKLQELERWKRQNEEQQAKAREEQQRVAMEQQQAQAEAEYRQGLAQQMAASEDPFVRAMHDDPRFVHAIFQIQKAHFDGQETISVEEAVKLKPRNGGSALLEDMRQLYSRLRRSGAFSDLDDDNDDRPVAKQAETGTRDAQRPAKKSATTLSQRDAQEASSTVDLSDDRAFKRYALEKMEQAAREEEAQRRARRAG